MKPLFLCSVVMSLALIGCSAPFQGIKIRIQSPPMDEAWRKVSLAISVDEYEVENVSLPEYSLETRWRPAKEKELSLADHALKALKTECKLSLRMEPRGKLTDVYFTPLLRFVLQDGTVRETVAGATHPLREKWEKAFSRLLEREQREED